MEIFFCDFANREACKVSDGDHVDIIGSSGLSFCGHYINDECTEKCIVVRASCSKGEGEGLWTRIVESEVKSLRERLSARNKQLRSLRRELRKKS